jgi:hypothetical protein
VATERLLSYKGFNYSNAFASIAFHTGFLLNLKVMNTENVYVIWEESSCPIWVQWIMLHHLKVFLADLYCSRVMYQRIGARGTHTNSRFSWNKKKMSLSLGKKKWWEDKPPNESWIEAQWHGFFWVIIWSSWCSCLVEIILLRGLRLYKACFLEWSTVTSWKIMEPTWMKFCGRLQAKF